MNIAVHKLAPKPVMDIYGDVHESATVLGMYGRTFSIVDETTKTTHVALYTDNHVKPPKEVRKAKNEIKQHFDAKRVKKIGCPSNDFRIRITKKK